MPVSIGDVARLFYNGHVAVFPVRHGMQCRAAGVDLRRTAIVSEPIDGLGGTPGAAVVVVDRPGRLVVRTSSDGRQLLAISERFHRGWRATVDGRPHAVTRINGDFIGCVVEPGTHAIAVGTKMA